MKTLIRPEKADDAAAISAILETAFPTTTEARLAALLRAHGKAQVSLVAEIDGKIVGHVLFSPVSVETPSGMAPGAGLGPIAVSPCHQKKGIGKRLVREGLAACKRAGCPFVVVLGAPIYYHRFGFRRAGKFGLRNEYAVDEEFMAVELLPGGLPKGGGLVKYAPEFAEYAV